MRIESAVQTAGETTVDKPTEMYQYNDDAGAKALLEEYATKGLQGFLLENSDFNAKLIIEAVKEIGYWNPVVAKHIVNEFLKTGALRWKDTRALSDGSQRLSDNPSEFELANATADQLKAHLKDARPVAKDEVKYSWQLPLNATREQVLASTPQAIKDWALRRRNAGLPDSV
jgi:hypothetical protein